MPLPVSTRRRMFAFLLAPCFSLIATAQAQNSWQPVPPEDLHMLDNPAMPGAPALLLDRDSHQDDDKNFLTEYYRIKILTEEGVRFANIEIPYVPKRQDVVEIRARRVRPDGTTAEFHGEIFDRLIVKTRHYQYQAKTFAIADVHSGDIVEYSYKHIWHERIPDVLKHPGSYFIDGAYTFPSAHWRIQHELFTRHARFSVHPLPKVALRWTLVRPPEGARVQVEPDGTAFFEAQNIRPLDHEEFAPPDDLLDGRIHFYYSLGLSEEADDKVRWYWSSVGRRQGEEIENFIGDSKKIRQAVERLVLPDDPPETKLRKIYDRVQQIRYLSYERERSEKESKRESLKENKSAEDVLNHGYANVNEINYLFAAMARAGGFYAFAVKVTDRSRHVFESTVLDPDQLDAVVIGVRLNHEDRYFDPATRFCPFEIIPWGESGVRGLRMYMVTGGEFVTVPGYHSDKAITRRVATANIFADGTLEGDAHISFSGEEALTRRLDLYGSDEAGRKKAMEEEIAKWMPDGAKVEITGSTGWESSQEDLKVECHFTLSQFATTVGRRLLAPLAVFQTHSTPLKAARRVNPVYFPYSYRIEDTITLHYPREYKVEALPAQHGYEFIDSRFTSSVSEAADGVQLQRTFALDGFVFDKAIYGNLRDFLDRIHTADTEQMVLQPAGSPK